MRTFILGAGASRHVGYPLAKSLGTGLLEWMQKQEAYPISLSLAIEFLNEANKSTSDFEDALTELDLQTKVGDDAPLEERIARAKAAEIRFAISASIQSYFTQIRNAKAEAYRMFAENHVRTGDTVITFNYDVSLERELSICGKWNPGDGYGFRIDGISANSPVQILKLHGSTNWLALLFGGARASSAVNGNSLGSRPVVAPLELNFLGSEQHDLLFPPGRESAALPVMILPTKSKAFSFRTSFGEEYKEFWDFLWLRAAQSLAQSEEVYICGYSLLPVDERACSLIKANIPSVTPIFVGSGGDTIRIVNEFHAASCLKAQAMSSLIFENWISSSPSSTNAAAEEVNHA